MSKFRLLAGLLLTAVLGSAGAGELLDLYDSVPPPASDGATALTYAHAGEMLQPEYLAFEQTLAQYRSGTQALKTELAADAHASAQASTALATLQARYQEYLQRNAGDNDPARALAKRKRWLQRAMGGVQMGISKAMLECDAPCTDQDILDHNAQLQARRDHTLDNEYRTWNALFKDWKAGRLPYVRGADEALESIGDPVAGTDAAQAVASYRERMADELEWLYSISRISALRAEPIHQGLTGNEPDSISGATPRVSQH